MRNLDVSGSGEESESPGEYERPLKEVRYLDRSFWAVFLTIAIIGTMTWLAIFEHNYHPRIYKYSKDVMILQVGETELDFSHPEGTFSIWWRNRRRHEREVACRRLGHMRWLSI